MTSAKQDAIGVQTGSTLAHLADFINLHAEGWREADYVPVQLLRSLCRLTKAEPARASAGFTSLELREEMQKQNPGWGGRLTDDASDRVRPEWKKLEKIFSSKQEGLAQLASEAGICVPKIDRDIGGGTGHLTRYRLVAQTDQSHEVNPAVASPLAEGQIRYICEDLVDAGVFAKIFADGFQTAGRGRLLFIAVPIFALILGLAVIELAILTIPGAKSAGALTTLLLGTAVILWALWETFGRLYQVIDLRVVRAPWWMQSVFDDRILEARRPPRFPTKSIKAVRYTATCDVPGCGGHVVVMSGGWRHQWRLVGLCEETPLAHVFTFDHVTRLGRRLSLERSALP